MHTWVQNKALFWCKFQTIGFTATGQAYKTRYPHMYQQLEILKSLKRAEVGKPVSQSKMRQMRAAAKGKKIDPGTKNSGAWQ